MEEEKFVTREEVRKEMSRLENEIKKVSVRLEERWRFWRERVMYISIIVGLAIALVTRVM
jgi:uncharacterized membrane protein YcjF (UPF0283 family)